jgi:hypothetical protein
MASFDTNWSSIDFFWSPIKQNELFYEYYSRMAGSKDILLCQQPLQISPYTIGMQISNDSQFLKSKSSSFQQRKLDRGTRSTNRKPGTLIRGDYTASDWSESEEV